MVQSQPLPFLQTEDDLPETDNQPVGTGTAAAGRIAGEAAAAGD
jgi:hypothetical protein